MSHVFAAVPGPSILAMVDPGAGSPAPHPLTPAAAQIPNPTPAYTVPRSWPAYVQLGSTLPDSVCDPKLQAWADEQLDARVGAATVYVQPAPSGLTPYPWQTEAAARFARVGQAMLSDDPGTGKTISAILSVVQRQARHADALPCLVVCPASVRAAWVKAWQLWAPDVPVAMYEGPKRAALVHGGPDVLVMSYEVMSRDADKLIDMLKVHGHGTLVLDEHHLIKSHDSARSRSARRIAPHAACRIVLSGTPITHAPDDLWPALNVLEPLAWPARGRFVQRYCETVQSDYGQPQVVGLEPARRTEFEVCLLGVQRRVSKADALELPPKVYSVREVEIPAPWRKVYDGMRDQMLAQLPDTAEQISVMSVLAQLTRLQQLAAAASEPGPQVVDPNTGEVRETVRLKAPSWKVDALLEVLAERPDQQVLVFSPSRQLIRLCEEALGEHDVPWSATSTPRPYATLVGGQTPRSREAEVERFQDGQARVMLATTQAGGVGVTLTAASTVVFLGRPFSLVEALQAEDRAHRIGSERHESVEIVDVIARDTVDAAVRAVLRGKAETLADVLRDPRVAAEVLGGKLVA